jgi:hypothetical protein
VERSAKNANLLAKAVRVILYGFAYFAFALQRNGAEFYQPSFMRLRRRNAGAN